MPALAFAWLSGATFVVSLLFFLYAYLVDYAQPGAHGDPTRAILFDVTLFTVFALHHSLFARSGAKRWIVRVIPAPLERALYTFIASIMFIGVCWWWQPVPGVLYRLEGLWPVAAHAVFAIGMAITLLSARRLDALELAGIRQVITASGHTPRARTDLLTTGVYGLVRHPIYLGWVMLVFGVPHMTMTRFVFATVSTLYLAVAIPFEERGLIETFGPDYASYQRKVRWRMLPGIY